MHCIDVAYHYRYSVVFVSASVCLLVTVVVRTRRLKEVLVEVLT